MPTRRILSASEVQEFDSPPIFHAAARKHFFHVPVKLGEMVASLDTPTNQVCFVVLYGYFKATHKFFQRQFHARDLAYVAKQLDIQDTIQIMSYKETTYRRHKAILLTYFGWRGFQHAEQTLIVQEIAVMVRSQLRPKLIFLQVLEILTRKKIAIPSYSTLSTLIIDAAKTYKHELSHTIEHHLSPECRQLLESLLEKEEDETSETGKGLRYQLTLLKKINQSTRPSKIKATIHDLHIVRHLFTKLQALIQQLDLPDEGIRYYATSVMKSEIFKVVRRAEDDRYLHLIAFIIHQYFKLQDTLLDILLTCTQSAISSTQREQKESYYKTRQQRHHAIRQVVGCLDSQVRVVSQIKEIIHSPTFSDREKVMYIDTLLSGKTDQQQTTEEHIAQFKHVLHPNDLDGEFYAVLESKSIKLQHRLAEIVKHIEFSSTTSDADLMAAITYYASHDGSVNTHAPITFLAPHEQERLHDHDGKFRVSLYKVFLFLNVADAIKAGRVNLTHSYKYRSLEEYLIPKTAWQQNKEDYLTRADLNDVVECDTVLGTLERLLNAQYQQTNDHILQGDNEYIRFQKKRLFTIATPKIEHPDVTPLADVFPTTRYISLVEVLATIHKASHFLDAFEHWHITSNRDKPRNTTFWAGIIGYGCQVGVKKMAHISQQITEAELDNTIHWYFSVENINAANTKILEVTDTLDLPTIYRQHHDTLHTSSDGQRFSVAVDSLNANFSFKYFGKDKGVSVQSFIDERHLLFYSTVISSSEREAAYVIDGLMHNDVVQSDIHSTDTHGYSEIVFGVMHLLGFSFAPRIKNLKKQQLYAFQERKHYESREYKILPTGRIKQQPIQEQWDDMLRLTATIKLKETTASQLFKRLNSYSKQHPLYQAFKEFGRILKSLFILKYLDELALRQTIQKMLNKIESAHKFAKAIAFAHNHEFSQSLQDDQNIAQGCRRLIENAIVCWNYLYLSQRIANEPDEQKRQELLDAIKHGSVVTWQHINLHGEYDFSEEKLQDTVGLDVSKLLTLKIF